MKIIYIKDNKKKPAIFLDRDGVIIQDKPGKYITSIKNVKIYKSFIDGFKKIDKKKYHIIIITNQSAINRGYISLEKSVEINNYIVKKLKKYGIKINAVYFCPHRPDEKCQCRKPESGLIKEAEKDYRIDFKNSFFIGDKLTDMLLAEKIKVKSIFVLTGQGISQLKKHGKITSNYVLKNLKYIDKIIK